MSFGAWFQATVVSSICIVGWAIVGVSGMFFGGMVVQSEGVSGGTWATLIPAPIGLALLVIGPIVGRRRLEVLRDGRLGWARLVERVLIDRGGRRSKRMYALEYELVDEQADGYRGSTARWRIQRQATSDDVAAITDDREEPVLWLPSDPRRTIMLDATPVGLKVAADGSVTARPLHVLMGSAVALAAIATNVLMARQWLVMLLGG